MKKTGIVFLLLAAASMLAACGRKAPFPPPTAVRPQL